MKTTPASNMDVKRRNRANTLRCILSCERISQMELSQRLALSWPTILQNVKELVELGLVQEVGQYESTGGRKAKAYAPVREARLAIGLDLTGNHVSVVLVDLSGQVVRYQRKSRPFSLDGAYLQGLGELVQSVMGDAPAGEAILGVGISLPGIVDSEAGLLRYSHILDLRDVPLDMLGRHIPYPCGFLNDANAAGFAEIYGASTAGNLVYLSLSNSVGGAEKQAVWREYLEYLSIAVNNLHMSFDCDVIVGGYVGAFLEEFGGPLRPLLEERNTFQPDSSYLKYCRYRLEASAVGAALTQVERFLQTL